MALNTAEELIEDIRAGKMVILMDDEDRENEGDIIIASECVTAEHINFMARFARGLICMPMTRERCELLKLPLMAPRNGSGFGTKFTVSIEAAEGVTTGISAADRARTVQAAVARNAVADDIVSPGHIFPLMAQPGGVLARAGHTEAACDLARMGGFEPSGVICEIMNDDGTMARRPELEKFAEEHGLKIGTIADLIHYRLIHERTVERISEQPLDTELGQFNLVTYRDGVENTAHMALTLGTICAEEPTLVRVHNMDPLRDLFMVNQPGRWSMRCHGGSGQGRQRRGAAAGQSADRAGAAGADQPPAAGQPGDLQHRGRWLADSARPRRTQDAPDELADEVQRDIRLRPRGCRIPAF